jgi:hypothetical protein
MNFDTKIAVVVRDDLLPWQALNVTAFTVSGIATLPDVIGENYVDGSGVEYLPMIRQPMLIFAVSAEQMRAVYQQARGNDVRFTIYTEDLFSTGHDAANREAVRGVPSDALNLVGMALFGPKKIMNRLTSGLKLHP